MYINVHLDLFEHRLVADDRCAGSKLERIFKIIYSSPYAPYEIATSHIVKY